MFYFNPLREGVGGVSLGPRAMFVVSWDLLTVICIELFHADICQAQLQLIIMVLFRTSMVRVCFGRRD